MTSSNARGAYRPLYDLEQIKREYGVTKVTPQQLYKWLRGKVYPREKMQEPKRQTHFTYNMGPMYFLGQQIVKHMQDAGHPAKILYCHRTPEHQSRLYAQGRTAYGDIVTRARPWHSPHQYYEAVDIIHPTLGWKVSPEYWVTLAACVRIVATKYDVELDHGHNWGDSAHIEIEEWRAFREQIGWQTPTDQQLWQRFNEVLPQLAKRLERDRRAPNFSKGEINVTR